MSRFHAVSLVALLCGGIGLASGQFAVLAGILVGWLTLTGLGVAIPQMRFFGPFLCRGAGSDPRVALTFDDGPDAGSTPRLLDLLREAGVQAAFFGVGQRVSAQPDLAARIVREGHLLENHSFSHLNTTNFFSLARLRGELAQTQTVIEQTTGVAPRWFRPPMGLSNPRVFHAARSLGLTVVGWTARGLDTRLTDPSRIVARITRRLRPGAIILLHDGGIPAERLTLTVKILLDTLKGLGYEVVRLDRLFA